MLFYFYVTTLQLASYLKEDPTVVDENKTDTARRIVYDQWTHGDFLCHNYVLGGLVDHLYNVYHKTHTSLGAIFTHFWGDFSHTSTMCILHVLLP
ncbi:hypothetical protein ACS0TY_035034 [Phlomoides rotata]